MDQETRDGSLDMFEEAACGVQEVDNYSMDSIEDIARIDFSNLGIDDVKRFHFGDLALAFEFYKSYAKARGFSARKSKMRKSRNSVVVQQNFVCFQEGYRDKKYYKLDNRFREPKVVTRCGCNAFIQVHVETSIGRWIVTSFLDEHNHELLDPVLTVMLPRHRRMTEADIRQINNFRGVGISTPHILACLASQSGGFEYVGFGKRDIYNHIAKKRRQIVGDVRGALSYLGDLALTDSCMFVRHESYVGGIFRNLFWCDGISQVDYQLFGDVLAFDATYKKNKYSCPLVVFSGGNHHNQTIVFAAALVSNEGEETYVWLLEQFLTAMKGKAPVSVITNGDRAMRRAIERVFPNSRHRLCAWHLMRNVTSNIKKPGFTQMFRKCMLGYYEVGVFQQKWLEMVEEFGVQDRQWINDEKKNMWATAYLRGKFFAGFRTTLRCEGLHSLLAKYVKSRYNLSDFVRHFQRCVVHLRHKEFQANYVCVYGEPVMQTHLHQLERSAADVYTREIFFLFRPMLHRGGTLKFIVNNETISCIIYAVSKYCKPNTLWHVSFYRDLMEFKCSCLRTESFGIPCEHIIAVLVYLDISELPRSLVLDRWTKKCKGSN